MDPRIAEYIEQFDSSAAAMLWDVREIILNSHPAIIEKFSYQIPFYYLNKSMLCYLAFNKKRRRFVLGFPLGFQMQDPENRLLAEDGQNVVKHFVISPGDSKIAEQIPLYIQLAIEAAK